MGALEDDDDDDDDDDEEEEEEEEKDEEDEEDDEEEDDDLWRPIALSSPSTTMTTFGFWRPHRGLPSNTSPGQPSPTSLPAHAARL